MSELEKLNIINMPAHPTNQWDRYGTKFEFIVMHYVGAVSTAKNNGSYYGSTPNIGASAHFFVDEHDIVSSVPLTMSAGHCGVDYSGGKAPYWNGKGTYSTNRRSIGIEMCCKRDSAGNWYIEPETVTNTVKLVRALMADYSIPAENVIRHYDVCWKNCPAPWVEHPEQWAAFKKRISEEEIDMTKAELDQLIDARIAAKLTGKGTKASAWAKDELAEAAARGITDGTNPGGYTTREQTAAMVLRSEKRLQAQIDALRGESA